MKTFTTTDTQRNVLRLAAFTSLIFGTVITLSPKMVLGILYVNSTLEGMSLGFWHFYGIVLAVLGIGYFIASKEPESNWQFVLIGFLMKLFGSYIFLKGIILGDYSLGFGLFLLATTAFWLVPFYSILTGAFSKETQESFDTSRFKEIVKRVRTSQNDNLIELSYERNVLLVFIRDFGCAFGKDTIRKIAKIDSMIKKNNLEIVFVHMSDHEEADKFFKRYYPYPVKHISDPGRSLYKGFNLKRGNFSELYSVRMFFKAIYLLLFKGLTFTETHSDSLQLGGLFVLSHGRVVYTEKAKSRDYNYKIKVISHPDYPEAEGHLA